MGEIIKKQTLKKQILMKISFALFFSMIISSIVGYIYFSKVVRNQTITDAFVNLEQLSDNLNFMSEDIKNFAKNIIVDEEITEVLKKNNNNNEIDRLKKLEVISKRLIFYNSLRTHIASTYIDVADGRKYSSANLSMDDEYVKSKFENERFKLFSQSLNQSVSQPYYSIDTINKQKVVCYKYKMMDIYEFGNLQGVLYVEVYLSYFINHISNYENEFENIYLMDENGAIIYSYGEMRVMPKISDNNNQQIYKLSDGYLLCKKVEQTGWILGVVVTNRQLMEKGQFVFNFFIVSFILTLTILLSLTINILEKMIYPITKLSKKMEKISLKKCDDCESIELDFESPNFKERARTNDEIQTLYECFDEMIEEINIGIEQKMAFEKQKKSMEFEIMLSQINPHYLYNVLNTVVYLASDAKNKNIVKLVNALIYSLQETLNIGEYNIYTTIEKELKFTECYLDIQRFRYQDTFVVKIECEECAKNFLVPKTIIQPLVENSIFHGILPKDEVGEINIIIKKDSDKLVIEINDNGVGFDEEHLNNFIKQKRIYAEDSGRRHIGVNNIIDRIEYLYGDEYGVHINSKQDVGTTVILYLPIQLENKNSI